MKYILFSLLVITFSFTIFYVVCKSHEEIHHLPDCSKQSDNINFSKTLNHRRLLFIATLDGKITAINVDDNGEIVWSLLTNKDGLFSSTISDYRIQNNGVYIRLVPSLDGNIYKMSEATGHLEPLPLHAEQLLRSTYKLGDDILISGGKESKTFGVSPVTGSVHYECGMSGCHNNNKFKSNKQASNNDDDGDVNESDENLNTSEHLLVIKQEKQVVRAVDPNTGREKWNFAVGENRLWLINEAENCHYSQTGAGNQEKDDDEGLNDEQNPINRIKILISDGTVKTTSSISSNHQNWSISLDTPIVNAWYLDHGVIKEINLFTRERFITDERNGAFNGKENPLMFIGWFNSQYYIQHSDEMKKRLNRWSKGLDSIYIPEIEENSLEKFNNQQQTKELSVINEQRSLGFYVYDSDPNKCIKATVKDVIADMTTPSSLVENLSSVDENSLDSFEQVIIVSLWHWWREVLVISVIFAVIFNIALNIIKRKFHQCAEVLKDISSSGKSSEHCVVAVAATSNAASSSSPQTQQGSSSTINANSSSPTSSDTKIPLAGVNGVETNQHNFINNNNNQININQNEFSSISRHFSSEISRFLSDFEPIQKLGKGGYGVVFEARNKIDTCHYAVKRILLPFKTESREKVMREVKALAKLEHPGIVRFYNSWLEIPPPGQDNYNHAGIWEDSELHMMTESVVFSSNNNVYNASVEVSFQKRNNFDTEENTENTNFVAAGDTWSSFDFKAKQVKNNDSSLNDSYVIFQNSTSGNESGQLSKKPSVEEEEEVEAKEDDNLTDLINKETTEEPKKRRKRRRPSILFDNRKVYLYIQMQLCQKDTLREWLRNVAQREKVVVFEFFTQTVSAVAYLHSKGLMHRDLKPSNIFFSMDGDIKIGDFGLVTEANVDELYSTPESEMKEFRSKPLNEQHTNRVGTKLYMSPEQINGESYSNKVDIFSLGVIFYEMLNYFNTEMERVSTLVNIRKRIVPKEFQEKFQSEYLLLMQLLAFDSNERPTAEAILQNEIFKDVDDRFRIIEKPFRRRTFSTRSSESSNN